MYDPNDYYPRRMSRAAIEALEAAELAEAEALEADHRAKLEAWEMSFVETAACDEGCFAIDALAHSAACCQANAVAVPVADAINGWLAAVTTRRAA